MDLKRPISCLNSIWIKFVERDNSPRVSIKGAVDTVKWQGTVLVFTHGCAHADEKIDLEEQNFL